MRRLPALGLLAVVVAGCGLLPRAAPAIEQTSWRAIEVSGHAPIAGAEPTAQFEGGVIRGTTGCNSYSGRVAIDGTNLTVSELGSTLIGCAGQIGQVEIAFIKALGTASSVRVEGSNLVLSGPGGQIVFRPD